MAESVILLDLSEFSLRGGERLERGYPLELAPIVLGGVPYDVIVTRDAKVVVFRVTGGFLVRVEVAAQVYGPCMRCLREVITRVEARQDEFVPTTQEPWEESQLSVFVDGLVVDIAGIAREAVVLALPGLILCSPDCKGLCARCGHDLNTGPCTCEPELLDPRWDKLRELRL